jgi:hypothetical protein
VSRSGLDVSLERRPAFLPRAIGRAAAFDRRVSLDSAAKLFEWKTLPVNLTGSMICAKIALTG